MTWEQELAALFADLEQQADAAFAVDRELQIADRSQAEYARVTLASRLVASLDSEVRLFQTGCRLTGPGPGPAPASGLVAGARGQPDCPRACSNDSLLFGSLDTFFNCAALSAVAYWARDGRRFSIPGQAERNASFLMGAAGASLAAFDERPVLASFVACAAEACAGGGDGIRAPCSDAVMRLTRDSPAPDVFDAINSFCPEA